DMRCAVFLGVLSACASVGEPPGMSGPALQLETGGAIRVIAPDYKISFSPTGLHMPDHLSVNAPPLQLLGAQACNTNLCGVAVRRAVSAAAGTPGGADPGGVTSDIMVMASGPAMVKIRVTYGVNYHCTAPQALSGMTDFTLFPGGRIVREDVAVKPSTSAL